MQSYNVVIDHSDPAGEPQLAHVYYAIRDKIPKITNPRHIGRGGRAVREFCNFPKPADADQSSIDHPSIDHPSIDHRSSATATGQNRQAQQCGRAGAGRRNRGGDIGDQA